MADKDQTTKTVIKTSKKEKQSVGEKVEDLGRAVRHETGEIIDKVRHPRGEGPSRKR